MNLFYKKMVNNLFNKRGLSEVVGTVLLILMTVVIGVVIFVTVKTYIDKSTSQTSCSYENLNKVKINYEFTCVQDGNLILGIELGDIDLDKLVLEVGGGGYSTRYEIIDNMRACLSGHNNPEYNKCDMDVKETGLEDFDYCFIGITPNILYGSDNYIQLKKQSGMTYLLEKDHFPVPNKLPEYIKVIPVIKGKECGESDEIVEFVNCLEGEFPFWGGTEPPCPGGSCGDGECDLSDPLNPEDCPKDCGFCGDTECQGLNGETTLTCSINRGGDC